MTNLEFHLLADRLGLSSFLRTPQYIDEMQMKAAQAQWGAEQAERFRREHGDGLVIDAEFTVLNRKALPKP